MIGAAGVLLVVAAIILSRHFEPYIRQQAILYLENRFDSDVEIGALHTSLAPLSALRLLIPGRGVLVQVDGEQIVLHRHGQSSAPPLLRLRHFSGSLDLARLLAGMKRIRSITLDGAEVNIPPRSDTTPHKKRSDGPTVVVDEVRIGNAVLNIMSKEADHAPLRFYLRNVRLDSAGRDVAMRYQAVLVNPKPPGEIRSSGTFGPWAEEEPADTPLRGGYTFENADLSVFRGIAGRLRSTGTFEGTLASITARGEAYVPDFRLTSAGNAMPLSTRFEVLVDGTNGNTQLKPVVATLGSTHFTTSGVIVKNQEQEHRSISLTASMPAGNLQDVVRLGVKGPPTVAGILHLETRIVIPPSSAKVRDKLLLEGNFSVTQGRFLNTRIRQALESLSRHGQGEPGASAADEEVAADISGQFHMAGAELTFERLNFAIPGAAVDVAGTFNSEAQNLAFRGVLMLQAKASQTVTGWKRWLLKPFDPLLANHGVGTYLHIKIDGDANSPHFGLDPQVFNRHREATASVR